MTAERNYSNRPGSDDYDLRGLRSYFRGYVDLAIAVVIYGALLSIAFLLGFALKTEVVRYETFRYAVVIWVACIGLVFFAYAFRAIQEGHPIQILRPWGGLGMNPGRPRLSRPIPMLLAAAFLAAASATLLLADKPEDPGANGSEIDDELEDLEGVGDGDRGPLTIESDSIDQLAAAATRLVEKYDPVLDTRLDSCIVWPLSREIQFEFNSVRFSDQPEKPTNLQLIRSVARSLDGFDYNIGYIMIAGFTDPVGDHEVNFNLSQRRADRVAAIFDCFRRGGDDCDVSADAEASQSNKELVTQKEQRDTFEIATIGRGEGFEVRRDHRSNAEKRGVEIMYCVRDGSQS